MHDALHRSKKMTSGDFKLRSSVCSVRLAMSVKLDIDPNLWAEAQSTATTGGVTIRDLVEEGLRRVISERAPGVQMDDFATGGHGLDGQFQTGGWVNVRECIYGSED